MLGLLSLAASVIAAVCALWAVIAAKEKSAEIEDLKTEATLSAMEIPVLRAQVAQLELALGLVEPVQKKAPKRGPGRPRKKAPEKASVPDVTSARATLRGVQMDVDDLLPKDQLQAANQEMAPKTDIESPCRATVIPEATILRAQLAREGYEGAVAFVRSRSARG